MEQCPACLNEYDILEFQPVMLPCDHTTCSKCIAEQFKSKKNKNTCIVCQKVSKMTPVELPKNLEIVQKIVRKVKKEETEQLVQDLENQKNEFQKLLREIFENIDETIERNSKQAHYHLNEKNETALKQILTIKLHLQDNALEVLLISVVLNDLELKLENSQKLDEQQIEEIRNQAKTSISNLQVLKQQAQQVFEQFLQILSQGKIPVFFEFQDIKQQAKVGNMEIYEGFQEEENKEYQQNPDDQFLDLENKFEEQVQQIQRTFKVYEGEILDLQIKTKEQEEQCQRTFEVYQGQLVELQELTEEQAKQDRRAFEIQQGQILELQIQSEEQNEQFKRVFEVHEGQILDLNAKFEEQAEQNQRTFQVHEEQILKLQNKANFQDEQFQKLEERLKELENVKVKQNENQQPEQYEQQAVQIVRQQLMQEIEIILQELKNVKENSRELIQWKQELLEEKQNQYTEALKIQQTYQRDLWAQENKLVYFETKSTEYVQQITHQKKVQEEKNKIIQKKQYEIKDLKIQSEGQKQIFEQNLHKLQTENYEQNIIIENKNEELKTLKDENEQAFRIIQDKDKNIYELQEIMRQEQERFEQERQIRDIQINQLLVQLENQKPQEQISKTYITIVRGSKTQKQYNLENGDFQIQEINIPEKINSGWGTYIEQIGEDNLLISGCDYQKNFQNFTSYNNNTGYLHQMIGSRLCHRTAYDYYSMLDFIISGSNQESNQNKICEVFNSQTNEFKQIADIIEPVQGFGCCFAQSSVLVIGGYGDKQTKDFIQIYNCGNGQWVQHATRVPQKSQTAAAYLQNKETNLIYFIITLTLWYLISATLQDMDKDSKEMRMFTQSQSYIKTQSTSLIVNRIYISMR